MKDAAKLKELEKFIEEYELGTLPTTDIAMQIYHELDAATLMCTLDRPAVYDTELLKSLNMTGAEFREAQRQALYLHIMDVAFPILEKKFGKHK